MEKTMKGLLEKISFGEVQVHNHVAVIPLFGGNGVGPEYLTMKDAMDNNLLTITEVSEGGHVPELKVLNRSQKPVILIDGEELVGAKQNRVLNTTILLKEKSETVIPVSCTEQGRWSYRSSHFEESGHIMAAKLRNIKNQSVSQSLKTSRRFQSNQSAVWNEIQVQAMASNVNSPTHAMRDIHEAKKADLDAYLAHFSIMPDQKGLLVLMNGEVAGMDMLSRVDAFRVIFPKLINSYIMDAILERPASRKDLTQEKATIFLRDILQSEERKYDSVGHGQDYRYEGGKIVGSALIHEDTVIHMAFFRAMEAEKAGDMSSLSQRRTYRTKH